MAGVTLGLVACAPSDPLPAQFVAVHASGRTVEILYTACTPQPIASVALLKSQNKSVFSESDPPIWKVTFGRASNLARFNVGLPSAGGLESVPLNGPLDQDALYVAEVVLADGHSYYQPFTLDKMGNKFAFYNTYLSQAQFDDRRACPS